MWALQWETLYCLLLNPFGDIAHILSLFLLTSLGPVNFLSIYTPNLCSLAENKDEFYEELESSIREVPATEHLYLFGDFNACLGAYHSSWLSCIGHFGICKLNKDIQRLLELFPYHDLCITNTFFATTLNHRVSWWYPRSCHWHQMDLTITQRPLMNCCLITHNYHSANCNTDHSLVGSKVHLQPKWIHQSKQTSTYQHCQDISSRLMWVLCWLHQSSLEWLPHRQCWREIEPHPCCHLQLCHGHLWQERDAKPRLV